LESVVPGATILYETNVEGDDDGDIHEEENKEQTDSNGSADNPNTP
jgi:hypothetical protein